MRLRSDFTLNDAEAQILALKETKEWKAAQPAEAHLVELNRKTAGFQMELEDKQRKRAALWTKTQEASDGGAG